MRKKKKNSSSSKSFFTTNTLLLILILIGFFIRVYRLDHLSFFVDEFHEFDPVKKWLNGEFVSKDATSILMTALTYLFSLIPGEVGEWTARLPAAIFGTLCIPVTYILAKRLTNKETAMLTAIVCTFSLYLVFWSRVCRYYTAFELFYLILLIVFLYGFENKPKPNGDFFQRHGLNKKYLLLTPIFLIISVINHTLTLFVFFSIALYCILISIDQAIVKKKFSHLNKYSLVAYSTIIGIFLLSIPLMRNLLLDFLGLFLTDLFLGWILPEPQYLLDFITNPDRRWEAFSIYKGVITTDMKYLFPLGILGFTLSFLISRKTGYFLISFFVLPLLLISFIFFEVKGPRYLVHIYPLFLISLSITLAMIYTRLIPSILKTKKTGQRKKITTRVKVLVFITTLILLPIGEIWGYINTQKHGTVVPKKLSNYAFPDWKSTCQKVSINMKKEDLIITTYTSHTDHYLGGSSIWFRQTKYDPDSHSYIPYGGTTEIPNAYSYEGFVNSVLQNQRGWLLTDYYFYNAHTDPRARNWAIQNLKYHFDFTNTELMNVFSWDVHQPEPQKQMLVVLGKENMMTSQVFNFNIDPQSIANNVIIYIDSEAIDHPKEAHLILNQSHQIYLPVNKSTNRETIAVRAPKSALKAGSNSIQFVYNEVKRESRKGYAVYGINLGSN